MTEPSMDDWYRASQLARFAMGRTDERRRHGYSPPRGWKADEDPLAHWCLTEAIVYFNRKRQRSTSAIQPTPRSAG